MSTNGMISRAKSLFGRSRPAEPARAERPLLAQQADEIGARLLVADPSAPIRNLYAAHKALSTGGWAAVDALGGAVLVRALAEAEMLQEDDPSPLFEGVVEQLKALKGAAAARATQEAIEQADLAWAVPAMPEVSEASHEEYEMMERSWIGTIPQTYEPTEPLPLDQLPSFPHDAALPTPHTTT